MKSQPACAGIAPVLSVALVVLFVAAWAATACSSGARDTGTTGEPPASTGGTAPVVTNSPSSTLPEPLTTSGAMVTTDGGGAATASFSIPVGGDGVTYDLEGAPPSGPSSFAVLDDGSVVIADTMAMRDGEPRLLRFDAAGTPLEPVLLSGAVAASIMDVATDGRRVAVLDVHPAMDRYRVLIVGESGEVDTVYDLPQGFHLEDGLSGLVWDDSGALLEIEGGALYARLSADGRYETTRTLVFGGTDITLTPGAGRTTLVGAGRTLFEVPRSTDLGGASLIGRAFDGSLLLVVDEVDLDEQGAFAITRRVQRYSPAGELVAEENFPVDQFLDISKTLEMTADGRVAHLVTFADHVEIRILDL